MDEKEPKKDSKEKPKSKRTCCCVAIAIAVLIIFILIVFQFLKHLLNSNSNSNIPLPKTNANTQVSSVPADDILNYFVETTTYHGGNNTDRIPLCRWTKNPITVEIKSGESPQTTKALDDVITEFNNISDTKLQRANNGDISVYYMPRENFPADFSGKRDPKGYAHWNCGNDQIIGSGYFYIDDTFFEDTPQLTYHDALLSITRHELFHVLGFYGHDLTKTRGCTTMSSIACLQKEYTQYDISAVRMMYNSNLPPGLNETEIREFFQNNIPL